MRARGKYFVSYVVVIEYNTRVYGDVVFETEYSFNEKTIEDFKDRIKHLDKTFDDLKINVDVTILNIINMNGL